MAQKTDAELTTDANVIKNETDTGENTAIRVGNHLIDLIDSKVNNDEAASSAWGDITGTLSAQTDLQNQLDLKEDLSNKATDFNTLNNTLYPSVQAVENRILAATAGLKWKNAVRVATTGAGTLATSFENGDTVDGVVLATGNRILIKDQADQTTNGIYTVNASGAPTRSTDADAAAELESAAVSVQEGTSNANTTWLQITDSITLGVSNIVWSAFGSSVPDADATTKGIAKLYPSTSLGTNTDGAPTQNAAKVYSDSLISNTAFGGGWDGDTTIAPSKNAVYDQMVLKLAITDFAKYILDQASADTSGATITLNMNSQVQRSFVGSASFSAAKAIALSNTTNSLCFNFVYTITNVTAVLTFPTEFQSKDPNWDSGANTWTPAEAGKYELGASYDGTNWIVKFFGAIN